jgi:Asp-tRNA(Asn)/Glu-tRNA(Gln) amidotransferase A subunit family amidase
MSASLQGQIERGLKTSAVRVRRGLEASQAARLTFSAWFDAQGLDALAMPTALGTAPQGLSATGDPVMCTLASFAGLPAITLPLLQGANGLPLGVQLVGRWGDDARLLRTARWLMTP